MPYGYVSFIHRDNVGYGVSFADFPGCAAVGETFEEAVRQGCEALAFHVDGLCEDGEPIPSPRSIDAIKGDAELADWRNGADIVLIPLFRDLEIRKEPTSLSTCVAQSDQR